VKTQVKVSVKSTGRYEFPIHLHSAELPVSLMTRRFSRSAAIPDESRRTLLAFAFTCVPARLIAAPVCDSRRQLLSCFLSFPPFPFSPRSQGSFLSFPPFFHAQRTTNSSRATKSKSERKRGGGGSHRWTAGAATTGGGPVRPARITFVTIARLNNLETCIHGGCGTQWARDARGPGPGSRSRGHGWLYDRPSSLIKSL